MLLGAHALLQLYVFSTRDVNSVEHDQLRLDVWDFNNEENVTDKVDNRAWGRGEVQDVL